MVYPLLIKVATYVGIAIAAAVVTAIVRRPVTDVMEGWILTEEMPVKTSLTLYKDGAISEAVFKENMRLHDMRQEHQDALLKWANQEKADKETAKTAAIAAKAEKMLDNANNDFVDLTLGSYEKELKAAEADYEKVVKDLQKLDLDETEFDIDHDVKQLELETRLLEKKIPAAPSGKGISSVKVTPITFSEFKSFIKSQLPDIINALIGANIDATTDNVTNFIKQQLPEQDIFSEEQIAYVELNGFVDRMRPDIFNVLQKLLATPGE